MIVVVCQVLLGESGLARDEDRLRQVGTVQKTLLMIVNRGILTAIGRICNPKGYLRIGGNEVEWLLAWNSVVSLNRYDREQLPKGIYNNARNRRSRENTQ